MYLIPTVNHQKHMISKPGSCFLLLTVLIAFVASGFSQTAEARMTQPFTHWNKKPVRIKTVDAISLMNDCLASSSIPVSVESTAASENKDYSSVTLCGMAEHMRQAKLEQVRAGIDGTYCELAKDAAVSFGDGDMHKARAYIATMQSSEEQRVILKALDSCNSRDVYNDLVSSIIENQVYSIYSVGQFTHEGRLCEGYLSQTVIADTDRFYELHGIDYCRNYADDTANDFHPLNRPNGKKAGDRMLSTVKFNGAMPEKYRYKSNEYSFRSNTLFAEVDSSSGTTEKSSLIDLRGEEWPVQTPIGNFNVVGESMLDPTQLMLNDTPIGVIGSFLNLVFYADLGNEQVVLMRNSVFMGNTPTPIDLHLLSFIDGKLRQHTHMIDTSIAHNEEAEIETAEFSVNDSTLVIKLLSKGQYTYTNRQLSYRQSENSHVTKAENKKVQKIVGPWICQTDNPNGTISRDNYQFNENGTFTSSTTNQIVSGQFSVKENQMSLRFTEVVTNGKRSSVDAKTTASITVNTTNYLEFSTIDVGTGLIRNVQCQALVESADLQKANVTSYAKKKNTESNKKSDVGNNNESKRKSDSATRYAISLASQLGSSSHPACAAIASHILTAAQHSAPESMRINTIDRLVDKAPSVCFY